MSRKGELFLGTAQLGNAYGVANRAGVPTQQAANAVLDAAYEAGIRALDTAADYGRSEQHIGAWLGCRGHTDVRIATKIGGRATAGDAAHVADAIALCAQRLGRRPDILLLHDAAALKRWDGAVGTACTRAVETGRVGAVGVSVYDPEEIEIALSIPEISFIQAPFNAFDRRILETGLAEAIRREGRGLIVRSVYLQGLLLMPLADLPRGLSFAASDVSAWLALCETRRIAPRTACLAYVRHRLPWADVAIGCEAPEQARWNAESFDAALPDGMAGEVEALAVSDRAVADPRRWSVSGA